MSSAPIGRYPHLFTRQHLEPIETHRAAILDRDDHTCLAYDVPITGRYWTGVLPCSTQLTIATAFGVDGEAAARPIFLRTLCTTHAAFGDAGSTAINLLYAANGWLIPLSIGDVHDALRYAAVLPVRAGTDWWLLDTWGERQHLTDDEADQLRTDIRQRWQP